MATTRSLKTLVFNVELGKSYLQKSDLIEQAFSANQTLESLTIGDDADRSLRQHLGPVLRGIALSGTSALRVLDLHCECWWSKSNQDMSSLCQALRATNSLRNLRLQKMRFTSGLMKELVGCLRKPMNSHLQCSSLTKLTLVYCDGVDHQFMELMQSKTIQWDNTPPWSSPLLELTVISWDDVLKPLASALHGKLENSSVHCCPTIATQLTLLHITLKRHTAQLFLPYPSLMRLSPTARSWKISFRTCLSLEFFALRQPTIPTMLLRSFLMRYARVAISVTHQFIKVDGMVDCASVKTMYTWGVPIASAISKWTCCYWTALQA
jgi:hypothetical protein